MQRKLKCEPSEFASNWTLDPGVTFLNHGSFGAAPRAVLEYQEEYRRRLEREPVRFFMRELPLLMDEARKALAEFIKCDPAGLVFVQNATTGVNAALRAVGLEAGDELLITNHEYPACRNAALDVAGRAGARVVEVGVPFPLAGPDGVIEPVMKAVTGHTRAAVLDHVTSQSALVLPIEELTRALQDRGVTVIIDGAHAPGMLDLSVKGISPDFYTGNCHKWMCAPKGTAFLWVVEPKRTRVRPLVVSHGAGLGIGDPRRYHAEFDWTGTHDPTPHLCVPSAIEVLGSMVPGGWPALRDRNRQLAIAARAVVCEALAIPAPCPESMLGSMAALPLDCVPASALMTAFETDEIQDALFNGYRIEVPVFRWPTPLERVLRFSCQLYNSLEQYRGLAAALVQVLG